MTARTADSLTAESYSVRTSGPLLFRIDTRDFPGAETLSIDFGEIGTVEYTVVPAVREAVRLAWRSSAGSVEHYSFPVVREVTKSTQKQRACGPEGHVVVPQRSERRTALASAYETPEMLEALAELTETPEVWIAGEEIYTPANVLTDEATVLRRGTMSCLEIEIRDKRTAPARWN